MKKRVVVALGHRALGTTLPEQKEAVKKTGGRSVFSRMTNTIIWLPALSRGFLL